MEPGKDKDSEARMENWLQELAAEEAVLLKLARQVKLASGVLEMREARATILREAIQELEGAGHVLVQPEK